MKPIRFRRQGSLYEFNQPLLLVKGSIESIKPFVPPDAIRTSVQVLRYRGVPYIREIHAIDLSRIPPETLPSLQSGMVIEAVDWESAIETRPLGFFSRLYCIGWRNGSLQSLSYRRHRLLSCFLNYRKGYAAGREWRCTLKHQATL